MGGCNENPCKGNKTDAKKAPYTYIEGNIKQNTIILMQCGIGKVNAAAGTVELIRNFQPDCIISTGVAGGIDTCLKVMERSSQPADCVP